MSQPIVAKVAVSSLPPDFKVSSPNAFLQAIAKAMQIVIPGTFTGINRGTTDPVSDTGLFYNSSQKVLKDWDTGTGRYQPVTDLTLTEEKVFYTAGDDLVKGWVVLNGRAINTITGLSLTQKQVLESVFGIGGTLPNRVVLGAFLNLPANNAFDGITVDDILPANDEIGALTSTAPSPLKAEYEALRDKTEILRDSSQALKEKLVLIRAQAEILLDSVRGSATSTVTAYAKIWVGLP